MPTTDSATWWPTPAAASAASRLRVEVSKNSSTAASSNDGEFDTSTTTDAPSSASASPSPVIVLTPVSGDAGDRLVAVLGELVDDLRADQPGAADDDDLHDRPVPVWGDVRNRRTESAYGARLTGAVDIAAHDCGRCPRIPEVDVAAVSHPVFARVYERLSVAMDRAGTAEFRRDLVAGLTGRVLEVGAGNGR